MRCDQAQVELAGWDERGTGLLSDALALHLDECAACRSVFDARFQPVREHEVPQGAVARPARDPRWVSAVVLVAAALVLVVSLPDRHVPTDDGLATEELEDECLIDDTPLHGAPECAV